MKTATKAVAHKRRSNKELDIRYWACAECKEPLEPTGLGARCNKCGGTAWMDLTAKQWEKQRQAYAALRDLAAKQEAKATP